MSVVTSTFPGSSVLRPQGARSFLPGDLKLVGANIAPSAVDCATDPVNPWNALHQNWDWTSQIKPQIDAAAGLLELNLIRLIGNNGIIISGGMTRTKYLAQWTQLINYCASQGLYVYAQGGGNNGGTWAQISAEMAAYAAHVGQFSNVIAIDLFNECDAMCQTLSGTQFPASGAETNLQALTLMSQAVRAAAPHLPLTFSVASLNGLGATYNSATLAPLVDFFDGHRYGAAGGIPAEMNNFCSAVSKPFAIGEFGASQSGFTAAQRQTFYATMCDYVYSHPSCMFACAWSLAPQDTVATNDWGLLDTSFALRATDAGDILKRFPRTKRHPLIRTIPMASDFTIPATNYPNHNDQNPVDVFGGPVLARARFTADIEVVTAGNVYDVGFLAALETDDATRHGLEAPASRPRVGPAVGRYTVTGEQIIRLPQGPVTWHFQVGHVSGSAADGILHGAAGQTRAVVEITPA